MKHIKLFESFVNEENKVGSKVTTIEPTGSSKYRGAKVQFYFQPGELAQILEGDLFNLWVEDPKSEDQAWKLLKKTARVTGVELTPILEILHDGRPDFICFRTEHNLGKEFYQHAQTAIRAAGQARGITVSTKRLIVEYILTNRDITTEDLNALLKFLDADDPEYVYTSQSLKQIDRDEAIKMIEKHPNYNLKK